MLSCKDISESVTDHLEGATTFQERLSMRFHLLICKHCRRFYRQFQMAIGASGQAGSSVEEPSDAEIEQLVRQLKERS